MSEPISDGARVTDPVAAAIEVFTREGYDATTVDDLAEAVELSRSTFFRRHRSKEDVVFADHELLLRRVTEFLPSSALSPLQAVCAAARLVFDHHVERGAVSLARYALLQEVPALRDRELVTSYRYERAFSHYLRDALPAADDREEVAIAFSAAVVAWHNQELRAWLLDPGSDRRGELDRGFQSLIRRFDTPLPPAAESRVVVAVIETGADPDAALASIRAALRP